MPRRSSASSIDRHVGERVRQRRLMIRMSQEKLGDHCGITFQQIQKYEKGTNRIGASRLQQIAGVLGVPASYFFEGLPTSSPAKQLDAGRLPELHLAADGLELAKAFMRLSDASLRRRVVRLVQSIAEDEPVA